MCGLVYGNSFLGRPVNQHILQQYFKQRGRGTEGFGLFDGEYDNLIKDAREHKILRWLRKYPSHEILYHHRNPTSTDNVKNACHPFSTKYHFGTNYILIHNGWINNDDELKRKHDKLGITYQSMQPDGRFNDSEALLWEFALYAEGLQDSIEAVGAIAFICIAITGNKRKLYWCRNASSPLKVHRNKKHLFLSSEGKGQDVPINLLNEFDYETHQVVTKELELLTWRNNQSQNQTGFWNRNDGYDDEEDIDILEIQKSLAVQSQWDKEVEATLNDYLERCDGYWENTFYAVEADIKQLKAQLKSTPDDDEIEFSISILEAVSEAIAKDTRFSDLNPIHPDYVRRAIDKEVTKGPDLKAAVKKTLESAGIIPKGK